MVADSRSRGACLCPAQVTEALAELPPPPAGAAAKWAGVHSKVAADPHFVLPPWLLGWAADNESSVAVRVQALFSLNSGAWVYCLWAPTQEKNCRSQKTAPVETGQTFLQKEGEHSDSLASWKTAPRCGLETWGEGRGPHAQTGVVRWVDPLANDWHLLAISSPEHTPTHTTVPATVRGIPTLSSSSFLESHESPETSWAHGQGSVFCTNRVSMVNRFLRISQRTDSVTNSREWSLWLPHV